MLHDGVSKNGINTFDHIELELKYIFHVMEGFDCFVIFHIFDVRLVWAIGHL